MHFFFGRENIKQLILWCDGSFRISEINRTYWAWPIIIPEWQQNTSARGVVSLWTMSDPITKMKSHHEPVLKKNHCHSEPFRKYLLLWVSHNRTPLLFWRKKKPIAETWDWFCLTKVKWENIFIGCCEIQLFYGFLGMHYTLQQIVFSFKDLEIQGFKFTIKCCLYLLLIGLKMRSHTLLGVLNRIE